MCQKVSNDYIKISIPSKPEYVSLARLTSSSIANRVGFKIEEIEDIKVAIGEACNNSVEHGLNKTTENYTIEFFVYDDKLTIKIKDEGKGIKDIDDSKPNAEELKEGGLGLFIIKTLMDEVEYITKENQGTELIMTKKLG